MQLFKGRGPGGADGFTVRDGRRPGCPGGWDPGGVSVGYRAGGPFLLLFFMFSFFLLMPFVPEFTLEIY